MDEWVGGHTATSIQKLTLRICVVVFVILSSASRRTSRLSYYTRIMQPARKIENRLFS